MAFRTAPSAGASSASPASSSASELQKLVEGARGDADAQQRRRFPAPQFFECEQYGSKARYLTQKLSPDVPLSVFLEGLYKAIVN